MKTKLSAVCAFSFSALTALTWCHTAHAQTGAVPSRSGITEARAINSSVLSSLLADNPDSRAVPRIQFGRVALREALARLSRISHVSIVADSAMSNTILNLPTLEGSIDTVLEQVIALLPKGVVVKKVMLPASPTDAPFDGDAVSALVNATSALNVSQRSLDGVSANPAVAIPATNIETAEGVEILGKRVSGAQSKAIIAALDLKPVYLLTKWTNPGEPSTRFAALQAEGLRMWMSLTPEQQKATADQQMDVLINMDSDARRALFAQQLEMSRGVLAKIQSLPDAQRKQLFLDMTNGKYDGTNPPLPKPNP